MLVTARFRVDIFYNGKLVNFIESDTEIIDDKEITDHDIQKTDDIYTAYELLKDFCSKLYITKINKKTFFNKQTYFKFKSFTGKMNWLKFNEGDILTIVSGYGKRKISLKELSELEDIPKVIKYLEQEAEMKAVKRMIANHL